MKILALVGSNAENSFNRKLLLAIKKRFTRHEIELAEIKDLPLYKEKSATPAAISELANKISNSDLVLIGTPEQQHSVTSALKSCLEWLSSNEHPFNGKKVAIVGTSVLAQGSGRSQTRLKSILASPGFGCEVFNGDEFMLGLAGQAFDEEGNLTNEKTLEFLDKFFGEVETWYQKVSE
ncbi:NADPH-dependent FMN reductase [Lactobacillus psittaci]|uniref:Flavoprotein n=1 Tax=Lactobacillus psittaci DSM 15354 TaxID=1122152 RepID=A0A0R1S435_9LACO|nr:NADPH-dependent FMN reductase [Lactobacillus psittaci]KRL63294.1 flavoprotein [Lactobacillus psittaci DSM 15354]